MIRYSPDGWWLPAGAVFSVIIVGLANVAPVLLLPLFSPVKPLDRESLRTRLVGLAERAGARVLGAYEWGLSEKTKKANAALTGIGSTRRILVSDTMLAEYSDEEIEVVLAHELGHHVHGDIWKGIFFESVLILAGFYMGARVLSALAAAFSLRDVADVAGLPLLLLAAGGVSLVMLPLAHALSRTFERKADRFALALTRNPAAFISAMRRLAAQNLAEEQPSVLVQWLFHSHPPVRERIAARPIVQAIAAFSHRTSDRTEAGRNDQMLSSRPHDELAAHLAAAVVDLQVAVEGERPFAVGAELERHRRAGADALGDPVGVDGHAVSDVERPQLDPGRGRPARPRCAADRTRTCVAVTDTRRTEGSWSWPAALPAASASGMKRK